MTMTALVTGASGGLGTAMFRSLSQSGYDMVAIYHSAEKGQQWIDAQKRLGYNFRAIQCDVSDYSACEKMAAEVGKVDVVVNNAGITRDGTLKKMDRYSWEAVIDTNLNSMFNVTRNLINGMLDRGYGRIINIASVNGQKGQFGQANYSAAKAGVHGFTKAVAQETARKGITVNTISPGYIATEMVMSVPENVRQAIIAQIPVGRLGTPAEIARIVVFLAAKEAGFITGAEISANGGQHMY